MSQKFVKIPMKGLSVKGLTPSEKMLLGLIDTMSYSKGYCFASNRTLGNMLGLHPNHIARLIRNLKDKKVIKAKYKKDDKNIEFRVIVICEQFVKGVEQNVNEVLTNCYSTHKQNVNQIDKDNRLINKKENSKTNKKELIESIKSFAQQFGVNLKGIDFNTLNSDDLDTLHSSISKGHNLASLKATEIFINQLIAQTKGKE